MKRLPKSFLRVGDLHCGCVGKTAHVSAYWNHSPCLGHGRYQTNLVLFIGKHACKAVSRRNKCDLLLCHGVLITSTPTVASFSRMASSKKAWRGEWDVMSTWTAVGTPKFLK
jgi:hypothetical protein